MITNVIIIFLLIVCVGLLIGVVYFRKHFIDVENKYEKYKQEIEKRLENSDIMIRISKKKFPEAYGAKGDNSFELWKRVEDGVNVYYAARKFASVRDRRHSYRNYVVMCEHIGADNRNLEHLSNLGRRIIIQTSDTGILRN